MSVYRINPVKVSVSPDSSADAQPLRFRVRRRLTEIAGEIDFVYAAILVEEPLESVDDLLAADGESYAFRTFAMSESHFDGRVVESVLKLLPEAYVERFGWGCFVTSSRNMMPPESSDLGLTHSEAMERSLAVSRLLANALKEK